MNTPSTGTTASTTGAAGSGQNGPVAVQPGPPISLVQNGVTWTIRLVSASKSRKGSTDTQIAPARYAYYLWRVVAVNTSNHPAAQPNYSVALGVRRSMWPARCQHQVSNGFCKAEVYGTDDSELSIQRSDQVPAGGRSVWLWGAVEPPLPVNLAPSDVHLFIEGDRELPLTALTNDGQGGLREAVATVRRNGYVVGDTSTYGPQYQLHVLIGTAAGSADGYAKRAFFFLGTRYLGTDVKDDSYSIGVVGHTNSTVTIRYRLYIASDPLCCPSAGSTLVRYHWNGARLVPLDPIPPLAGAGAKTGR